MNKNNITIYHVMTWSLNKNYNPITKRTIKNNTTTYKMFEKKYKEYFPLNYSYIDSMEDRDPISLELFWTEVDGIKKMVYPNLNNLYIYRENNIVHCFENTTLQYMKYYNTLYHPITREKLPLNIFDNMKDIKSTIEDSISLITKTKNVFNLLTNISIFIDSDLFIKLKDKEVDKLYFETYSFYNENINVSIKNELNTFTHPPITFYKIEDKKMYLLDCYMKLLNSEIESIKYMICYIVVGGLSIVIPKIKELYPDIIMNWE